MYEKDGKIIYTAEDFEQTIEHFDSIRGSFSDIALFSIYQGSLTLGHRLSKEYGLPHSILKYQRLDGHDDRVSILYDAVDREVSWGDKVADYKDMDIFIIDDIWDTGETMEKCTKFIEDNYLFATLNRFVIFSNSIVEGLHYQHYNPEGKWVKFLPWEGDGK